MSLKLIRAESLLTVDKQASEVIPAHSTEVVSDTDGNSMEGSRLQLNEGISNFPEGEGVCLVDIPITFNGELLVGSTKQINLTSFRVAHSKEPTTHSTLTSHNLNEPLGFSVVGGISSHSVSHGFKRKSAGALPEPINRRKKYGGSGTHISERSMEGVDQSAKAVERSAAAVEQST